MLGKPTVPDDLLQRIEAAGLRPAAYGALAADDLLRWPALRRHGPFDRQVLTHAAAEGTVLFTVDRVLLDLTEAPVQGARA